MLGLIIGIGVAAFAGSAEAGAADTSLFTRPDGADWAISWLRTIFHGAALPSGLAEDPTRLGSITVALRAALSIYSFGMLALGGLLVLYHVVAMIAETAHYGTAMGRRANQFWTPIRFVVAIGLLVPISGGLSAGQYLVVKLAEQGSGLASNAWHTAVETMKDSFSGFAPPRSPDLARLSSVAVEMEVCRNIYHQVYASLLPDVFLPLAGDIMVNARKIAPQRLTPETWRYSNMLHGDLPLCGEYRFMAQNGAGGGAPNRMEAFANDLAAFSHDSATRLIFQSRDLADAISASFLPTTTPNGVVTPPLPPTDTKINGALSGAMEEQRKALATKLQSVAASSGATVNALLDNSAQAGWVHAGVFVADLAAMQSINGNLSTHAVPVAQAPIFGHTTLTRTVLRETIAANPTLRVLTPPQLEKLNTLYEKTDAAMKLARQWLYGGQIANAGLMLTDPFDMQDALSPASDAQSGFFIFNRLLDAASVTYGVWAEAPSAEPSATLSFLRDRAGNPLLALAEFGRRYGDLGSYLIGMTGIGLSQPGVVVVACLFALVGGLFSLAGLTLTFLLPLLPLFRFFFGVLVWLLAIFEAVVALPLVALAHLNPVGDGLSGSTARHAYWLWLGIFMRPLLTLFGFVIGLVALAFAMSFLNGVFAHLIGGVAVAHDGVLSGVRVALALLYVVFAYIAVNQSFKGINLLPDMALNWLGQAITAEPSGVNVAAQSNPTVNGLGKVAETSYVTGGGSGATSANGESATQRDGRKARERNIGAALLPAYQEKPLDAVTIPTGGVAVGGQAAAMAAGGSAASSSSASVSANGVSATAIATAIAKQMPVKDPVTHPEIIRAANALSLMAEAQKVAAKAGDKPPPTIDNKKGESPEQHAATPKDDDAP